MTLAPLKPCPFCGSPAQAVTNTNPEKVGCFNPQCGVKPKASSTCSETAINKWNERSCHCDDPGDGAHWRDERI